MYCLSSVTGKHFGGEADVAQKHQAAFEACLVATYSFFLLLFFLFSPLRLLDVVLSVSSSSNIALDFQYSWCVFPSFTDQDFMGFLDEKLSIRDEASAKKICGDMLPTCSHSRCQHQ